MIVLAGANLVLPDRVQPAGTLIIDDHGRIEAIEPRVVDGPAGATRIDLAGRLIVPGFIDVHVHGVEGIDVLDGPAAVTGIARRLPRYGVTAFCPTSVACEPAALATLLASVSAAQEQPSPNSSRVLGAHLESNFVNPEWNGAQPIGCLRQPPSPVKGEGLRVKSGEFTGREILEVITAHRAHVGIITLAPELEGGLDLVREFVTAGHRVSIGHTGATYEQAREAIAAGVSHATHLFNRMSAMTARAPGVVGAVLESEAVAAEIICDAFHVHPSLVATAIRAKSVRLTMAITDGTAGAGLPPGSRARLGSQTLIVTTHSALLEDGTLAGSILTMDGAFRMLVERVGLSLPDAVRMCASTPAERLGLTDCGRLQTGLRADLTVLGPDLRVRQTYVGGAPALEH